MKSSILVVGGGPAGLSAAIAAASAGANVLLVDENEEPGGQLDYRITDEARSLRARLLAELVTSSARVVSRAVAWSVFVKGGAAISNDGVSSLVGFDRLILATGSTDRNASFSGGTLPGVLTARAAQILMHRHRVLPGRRFAVIGGHGAEIAADLERSGGEVVVRVPESLMDRIAATGTLGIERLTVNGTNHDVDAIVLALGTAPDPRLAIMAECAVLHDRSLGGFVPVRDVNLRTSNERIYVAGEMAGARDLGGSVAEGRLAGLAAAASLGLASDADVVPARLDLDAIAPQSRRLRGRTEYVQFAGQEQWV